MLFSTDRAALRQAYVEAWRRHRQGLASEPLQAQIAAVVADHPEYHALLEAEDVSDHEFPPEAGQSNPFLHMGMHLALREQVATDRPAGIAALFARLARAGAGAHAAEHAMMECLGESLWRGQRDHRMPDETAYLECLRRLVRG